MDWNFDGLTIVSDLLWSSPTSEFPEVQSQAQTLLQPLACFDPVLHLPWYLGSGVLEEEISLSGPCNGFLLYPEIAAAELIVCELEVRNCEASWIGRVQIGGML